MGEKLLVGTMYVSSQPMPERLHAMKALQFEQHLEAKRRSSHEPVPIREKINQVQRT
jgi:hypothetical protein